LYREDDYHFFEIQFKLAETLEKAGQTEEANELFDLCFKNMDGRLGDNKSDLKSVKSQVSRAISIRARNNSAVGYSQR
jgi:tetratricopeptide (TPR) repeat protein